ncbi:MAG: hypothetical protein Q7J27_14120, partial [Syntrophales bacterium]|nr:hypothetical protein [Syntrophales bacterium]
PFYKKIILDFYFYMVYTLFVYLINSGDLRGNLLRFINVLKRWTYIHEFMNPVLWHGVFVF